MLNRITKCLWVCWQLLYMCTATGSVAITQHITPAQHWLRECALTDLVWRELQLQAKRRHLYHSSLTCSWRKRVQKCVLESAYGWCSRVAGNESNTWTLPACSQNSAMRKHFLFCLIHTLYHYISASFPNSYYRYCFPSLSLSLSPSPSPVLPSLLLSSLTAIMSAAAILSVFAVYTRATPSLGKEKTLLSPPSPTKHDQLVIKTRQRKATTPEDNSFFFQRKKGCLRRDLNPWHLAYCADALPAEPPRQLSWAGWIIQGQRRLFPLNRVTLNSACTHAVVILYPYLEPTTTSSFSMQHTHHTEVAGRETTWVQDVPEERGMEEGHKAMDGTCVLSCVETRIEPRLS